jgi:hypothetical protein
MKSTNIGETGNCLSVNFISTPILYTLFVTTQFVAVCLLRYFLRLRCNIAIQQACTGPECLETGLQLGPPLCMAYA